MIVLSAFGKKTHSKFMTSFAALHEKQKKTKKH